MWQLSLKKSWKFFWSAEVSGWCCCSFQGLCASELCCNCEGGRRAVSSPLAQKHFEQFGQSPERVPLCLRG